LEEVMIGRAFAIASLLLMSCGGDSVEVDNVDPEGSVGGIILDAETRLPIEGIELHLLAGGRLFDPETTDADGAFQFTGVPGGDVILTAVGGETHSGASLRGTVPTAAGDFPLGNATWTVGPIGLIPIGSTFKFRVLDELGAPVSGYSVGVETQVAYVDYSGGYANGEGQVFQQVQTDGDGYATVTGVPNYFALGSVSDAVVLFLPPRDGNSDGIFEFPGGDVTLNVRSLDPTPDVILDGNLSSSLTIRASTVPALISSPGNVTATVVQPSAKLYVTFNLPIQPTVDVSLSNEQGGAVGVPTAALDIRDDTLEISLGGLGLDYGSEYNLAIHAVAAVGDRFVAGDFAASFFTVSMDTSVSVASATRDAATQVVTVMFNEPIGFGNVGSNSSLSGGNCVTYFGYDINGANGQGDFVNELGATSCNVNFASNEWNPPGLPTLSGYSSRWYFTAPLQSPGGEPLPGGITVHLLFSYVVSAGSVTERPDGRPVSDMTFTLP